MKIKILIKPDEDNPEWLNVSSGFPHIEAFGRKDQEAQLLMEVKGACLCCIGLWSAVPDSIEFEYNKF